MLGPGENVQPPDALISRGLEVHPDGGGTDLDVWIDRSLIRKGYAWSVPAAGEQRVGVGSYEPRDHVKEPTQDIARAPRRRRGPLPGQLVPARAPPGGRRRRLLRRRQRGPLLPPVRRGDPHRVLLRDRRAGGSCGACSAGEATREQALAAYGAYSARHAPAFGLALRLQRLVPALPPRALSALLAVLGRERPCRRAFSWYLEQAHPRTALRAGGHMMAEPVPMSSS